jgi:hypothetical protein
MRTPGGFELTYCSNIHPASGWRQVYENLRRIPPDLKRRLSPRSRFGIGLRLSNKEAEELLQGNALSEFSSFLSGAGLYVALLNGFPLADFHDCCLKDQVFAPDWHTAERVEYTLRLVEILSVLLPENLDGGVSTCPLSYKRWQQKPDWDILVRNVVNAAHTMFAARRTHGRVIHLDIEPEPDGLIENTQEFLDFYKMLLSSGAPLLAASAQLTRAAAEDALRTHVTVCYDLCHFAVEQEDPTATLAAFASAGVPIGRAQISSAIKTPIPPTTAERETLRAHLAPLADPTYLHQIIGQGERFPDLPEGLAHLQDATSQEWRVHYHVPLFLESYGPLHSTQTEVREAVAQLSPEVVRHLEIETYTWSVLPPELKLDIVDSIEREYRWVLAQL